MSNIELFNLLGEIDDKFYEEVLGGDSEKPMKISVAKQPFSIKRLMIPIAACLAVIVGIGAAAYYLKNRDDIISPNPDESNSSNVTLFNPAITADDISICKALLKERYPDIDQGEDNSASGTQIRVIDVDFDGADEVLVRPNDKNPKLFIFEKTADGMVEGGAIDNPDVYFLNDELFKYDADDGQYWYYYDSVSWDYHGYDKLVNIMGRIAYDGGNYSVDYPLVYGYSLDTNTDGVRHWVFKTDCSETAEFVTGIKDDMAIDLNSNITSEEFEKRWNAHTDLPAFDFFNSFEEEYPIYTDVEIPVLDDVYKQADKRLSKVMLSSERTTGGDICLLGDGAYREVGDPDNIIRFSDLYLGYVVNDKLCSTAGFGGFMSTARSGYSIYVIDTNLIDQYVNDLPLTGYDGRIILFKYQRPDSDFEEETAFVALDYNNKKELTLLYGDISAISDEDYFGGGIGINATTSGDLDLFGLCTYIDNVNQVKYVFNPDAFLGNPFETPHYTAAPLKEPVTIKGGRIHDAETYTDEKFAAWDNGNGNRDAVLATQQELDRFNTLINSDIIKSLDIWEWTAEGSGGEGYVEDYYASKVLNLLRNATFGIYEQDPGPSTGMGYSRYLFYDENGDIVLEVFEGIYFIVQFDPKGTRYILNAEGFWI